MKNTIKTFAVLLIIGIWLAAPGIVTAGALNQSGGQTIYGDQLIFGDNYTLQSGQTLQGDLVVLGGNAEIVNLGGAISGTENATVRGGIQTFSPRAFQFDKGLFRVQNTPIPNNYTNFGAWLISVLGKIMQILAMAVLAVIVLLVDRKSTRLNSSHQKISYA